MNLQNTQSKPLFKLLDWDSAFFGYSISKTQLADDITIDENTITAIKGQLKDKLHLIYCNHSQAEKIKNNFNDHYCENKITYIMYCDSQKYSDVIACPNFIKVTDFAQINSIYYLALEAGKHSRYRLDKNMLHFEFEKLYFEWIYNSIQGKFDDEVYVYKINNEPIGLITLKYKTDSANIGLISTSLKHQNQGIGSLLIKNVLLILKEKNIKTLTVSTQKNNPSANQFYLHKGFKVQSEEAILHIWNLQ